MTLRTITEQLRQRIGLDPASLGPTAISNVVSSRMRSLGLPDLDSYTARLASSPEEFTTLIDEIVVLESWFFRGGGVFFHLAEHIRHAAETSHSGRAFRILSAPCATGEEPYSLAIALAELNVPRTAWQLEAVDLSSRHLDIARQGRYAEFSFRQTDPPLRDRYFQATAAGWELDPTIRSTVRFREGNLVDPRFLFGEAGFDLILCRNLLIYLHPAARQQVVDTLDRLLNPAGQICMGHAEPLSSIDSRFSPVAADGNFLFHRLPLESPESEVVDQTPRREKRSIHKTVPSCPTPTAQGLATTKPLRMAGPSPLESTDVIARARAQANAGELDTAMESCRACLETAGPSADLYALIGEIHQARQATDEAIACFQKSLYLQPDHKESLLHLLLLYQQAGANSQVAALQRRLSRASTKRGEA